MTWRTTSTGGGSRRLITQALEATRFARALVEEAAPDTSRLIVWRTGRPGRQRAADQDCHPPVGPFRFGVHSDAAKQWARAEALDGSPFRRGRRTVIALDRREPGQHSRDTHDRHYVLPDERAQAGAAEAIAAGAEDAAARARSAVLIAQMRDAPVPRGRRDSHRGLLQLPRQPLPVAGRRLRRLVPDVPGLPERAGPSRAPSPPRPPARGAGQPALRPAPGRLGGGLARCPRPPGRPPAAAGRRAAGAQGLARVTDADRELVSHLLTGALGMTAAADLDPYLLPLPTPGSPVVLPHLAHPCTPTSTAATPTPSGRWPR